MGNNSQIRKIFVLRRNSGQGGAEKSAERLASQLSRYYSVERMWAGNPYRGIVIPGSSGPPWWRSWRYTRHIDGLGLVRKGQLVLSLEYGPDCDIYRAGDGVHRLNVLRRYGKRKGWMLNPWHWFAPRQERKCLESAKVIVANSNLVERLLHTEYPHLAHKTTTIYNGFDPSIYKTTDRPRSQLREALGLPSDGLMLLLSGHSFVRKGLHHAITLLDRLVHDAGKEAFLVVAGKGDAGFVAEQIKKAGLTRRIHFLGSVSGIDRYYQAADFMVLPTREDPFSNACLEALACGCPVITSDQNGAAEILDETNGMVMGSRFDEADFVRAAGFICHFHENPRVVAGTVSHLTQADEILAYRNLIGRLFGASGG
uniref:UDP-glucose:(Heptosyl)LPS alpha-1,3-glucosyltransferase n=1 Tax=Candidatus Kentrum eta TaxID=2126337 RepID=A0A450VKM7_9GAMM|nr:MAG: UDP-glucose:(heptosyl)LPS alpha-1,3-glucosyltransferase [Candidatus Kentron sp. H]VFK02098.1 MAG: UDP-glucose:(heptosyl)LPS alpha-1,3-glucosyltransferase [Candidatus Kentron sp. H]VFK05267.1 MAG: UDP-glucose:(heptosyl)LPS alpha-1,3-glucosyltransferase [Candidatus Kentron sp. H]